VDATLGDGSRLHVVLPDLSASPWWGLDNVDHQVGSPVSGIVADGEICRWLTTIESVLVGQGIVVQLRGDA
jgi:hypothetical protein